MMPFALSRGATLVPTVEAVRPAERFLSADGFFRAPAGVLHSGNRAVPEPPTWDGKPSVAGDLFVLNKGTRRARCTLQMRPGG
jgi:hypothetical protein